MQQQRVGGPFGDIYLIDTPYIDRLSQQMYAEQKQREAIKRQKAEAADNEFAKNIANVRDADIDDISNLYGEWKLHSQELMKKKGGVTPQDQLQNLRLKANVSRAIQGSKTEKGTEEQQLKTIMEKPDDFEDYAYDRILEKRKMPISSGFRKRIKNEDGTESELNLADYNDLRYKGTDFNFQEADKKAAGDLKPVLGKEALEKDGFTFKTPVYQFGNTPSAYKQSLLGAMAQRKAGDAAARLWRKIPPEMVEQVDALYNNIPKEKLERMGLPALEDLNAKNPDNAAEQYASHMAKLYAINAQPKEDKPLFRDNKKAIMDAQEEKEKRMANLRHGLAVALKKTPGAKDEGSEDDSLYIQDYWDGVVNKALSNKDNEILGNVLKGGEYRMELDPTIAKAFIRQGIEPEEMTVNKDGVVTPKYFTTVDDGKGGTKRVLDEGLSKPLTRTQALLALGVKATTGKQRYAEGKAAVDENKGTKPKTYQGLDKNGNPIFK